MEALRQNLSSLLLSHRRGIHIFTLQDLFMKEFGAPINYKKYGYEDMLQFMYGLQDIVRVEPGRRETDKILFPVTKEDDGMSASSTFNNLNDDEDEDERNLAGEYPPAVNYMERLQQLMDKTEGQSQRGNTAAEEEDFRLTDDLSDLKDEMQATDDNIRDDVDYDSDGYPEELVVASAEVDTKFAEQRSKTYEEKDQENLLSQQEQRTGAGDVGDQETKRDQAVEMSKRSLNRSKDPVNVQPQMKDEELELLTEEFKQSRISKPVEMNPVKKRAVTGDRTEVPGAVGNTTSSKKASRRVPFVDRKAEVYADVEDKKRRVPTSRSYPGARNELLTRKTARAAAPITNSYYQRRAQSTLPTRPDNDFQAWKNKLLANNDGLYVLKMPAQTGMDVQVLEDVFTAYGSTGLGKQGKNILVNFDDSDAAALVLMEMSYMYQMSITDECNISPGYDPYGTKVLMEQYSKDFNASCTPSVYIGHIPEDLDMGDILPYFESMDFIGWKLQVVRYNRHALIYFDTLEETQTAACIVKEMMTEDRFDVDVSLSMDTERLIRLVQTSNSAYMTNVVRRDDRGREKGYDKPARERKTERNASRTVSSPMESELDTDDGKEKMASTGQRLNAEDVKVEIVSPEVTKNNRELADTTVSSRSDISEEVGQGRQNGSMIASPTASAGSSPQTDSEPAVTITNGVKSPSDSEGYFGGARPKRIAQKNEHTESKLSPTAVIDSKNSKQPSPMALSHLEDQNRRYQQELIQIDEQIQKLQERRASICESLKHNEVKIGEHARNLKLTRSLSGQCNDSMPSLEVFDDDDDDNKVKESLKEDKKAVKESPNEKYIMAVKEVQPCVEPVDSGRLPVKHQQEDVPHLRRNLQLDPRNDSSTTENDLPLTQHKPNQFVAYVLGETTAEEKNVASDIPFKMKEPTLIAMMRCCFPNHDVSCLSPRTESKLHVIVTCKERINGYFWAQVKNEELQNHAKQHLALQDKVGDFEPVGPAGDRALAPYDGEWFRCWIIARLPNNRVRVFFVDYGNEEVISDRQCLLLPEEYWTPPPAARPFKLNRLDEANLKLIEMDNVLMLVTGSSSQGYIANVTSVQRFSETSAPEIPEN